MMMRPIFAALVFCGINLSAAAETASSDSRREPVLTVLGQGSYEVKPDTARFRATLSTDGKTLEGAMKQHGERAARAALILEKVKSLGLEVEKSSFRTNERRSVKSVTSEELARGLRPSSTIEGYTAATDFYLKSSSLEGLNQAVTTLAA
jgi:uncharacterized protein